MINTSGYVSIDFEGTDDGIKSRANVQALYPDIRKAMVGYHLKEIWKDLSDRGFYFKSYRRFCDHVASEGRPHPRRISDGRFELFHQAPGVGAER